MIERFVARVGKVGAILILAAAIVVIGFGGGVVEHFRLTAGTEQGDSQTSSSEQKAADSKAGDESGNGQQSEGAVRASAPRQQSESTNGTGNNQQ